MNPSALEQEFLCLWRDADRATRDRIRRLVAGVLAGRITLTLDEVRRLTPAHLEALADALPDDALADWVGHGRPS